MGRWVGITTTHQRERPLGNDLWRVNTHVYRSYLGEAGLVRRTRRKRHVVGEFFTRTEAQEFASRCYRNLDRGYSKFVA
jgi:hypothetical protein